nr:uncharacterized protein LOC119176247 isoform X2 [Rhipicephalus microplus]
MPPRPALGTRPSSSSTRLKCTHICMTSGTLLLKIGQRRTGLGQIEACSACRVSLLRNDLRTCVISSKGNNTTYVKKQRSGAAAADIPTIKWPHFEAMLELMEGESEPVASPPRPRHAAEPERTPDTAEETRVDTCSNESCSSRRQRTCEGASNAGEGTSHEAVAQACMEHLEHIRANKGVIKKDNIGFFALRTDARLRELPVHIAQDVMHAVELMLYEAKAKLRQSSEAN